MSRDVELVVVVQPAQAFRLDLAQLCAADDAAFALVTGPGGGDLAGAERLAWIAASDRFDGAALVEVLRARAAVGPGVRLVTGMETEVMACARAREALGLAGPRPPDVHHFLDKAAMKRRLAAAAPELVAPWILAPAPEAVSGATSEAIARALGLPLFVKPIDAVGSEGAQRLDDRAALERFLRAPRSRPFEIDAFLEGPVFNADAIVVDGALRWFGACELLHPPAECLRGATLASWTLADDEPDALELRALVLRVVHALAPPDGALHLEAVRTPAGFRFLEVACRNAGWLVPDAYLAACGVDLRVAHLRAAAGLDPGLAPRRARAGGWMAAIQTRPGRVVARVDPALELPHRLVHRPGRSGGGASRAILLADLLCELVAWDDDHARLRAAIRALDGFEPYVLEDDRGGAAGPG